MSSVSPICILSSTLRMKSSSTSGRRVTSPRAAPPPWAAAARAVGLRLDRRHHLLQILVVLPLLLLLVHLHLRVLVLVVVVVERHLLEVVRVVGVAGAEERAGRRVEVEGRGHRGSCAASLRGAAKIARAARASPALRSALEERSEAGVERRPSVPRAGHRREVRRWDFPFHARAPPPNLVGERREVAREAAGEVLVVALLARGASGVRVAERPAASPSPRRGFAEHVAGALLDHVVD